MQHDHDEGDESCPKCWAALDTPLFCESCEELLAPERTVSPFEALGVEKAYPVNRMALRKKLLSLSRRLHPDFHSTAGTSARDRAERNTAELNAAFEILSDDFRRADWIVGSLGGPGESQERQMPPAFLAEVLEWNESIEEAKGGSAEHVATLGSLRADLADQRDELMDSISAMLTPLPEVGATALVEVRRRLNAVRYIDRTLREIAELELSLATNESSTQGSQ